MIIHGNNIEVLKTFPDNHFSSIVTDAPYGLGKEPKAEEMLKAWLEHGYLEVKGTGFMGKKWDAFVPQPLFWKEAYRVLKPGGHVLSFFGTRTYDWGVMAMRLAGFEIKDCIQWLYGSGFPKSHNISKALDKMPGIENEINAWEGWGTALKPANEPIVLARKPLEKGLTISENILKFGTGGINIDAIRIAGEPWKWGTQTDIKGGNYNTNKPSNGDVYATNVESNPKGRFPANIILSHHPACECIGLKKIKGSSCSPDDVGKGRDGNFTNGIYGKKASKVTVSHTDDNGEEIVEDWNCHDECPVKIMDNQSAGSSRFFYVAKVSPSERNWGLGGVHKPILKHNSTMRDIENADWKEANVNNHATIKPVSLMRYLVRMITPPGGICLDAFVGSGSTGIACKLEGFEFVGIDEDIESCKISEGRIENWTDDLETMKHESIREILKESKKDLSQLDIFKND